MQSPPGLSNVVELYHYGGDLIGQIAGAILRVFFGENVRNMVVFYHALASKIGAILMLFDVKRQPKDIQSHVWGFLNEISGNEFWTYGNDQMNQTARLSRFNWWCLQRPFGSLLASKQGHPKTQRCSGLLEEQKSLPQLMWLLQEESRLV